MSLYIQAIKILKYEVQWKVHSLWWQAVSLWRWEVQYFGPLLDWGGGRKKITLHSQKQTRTRKWQMDTKFTLFVLLWINTQHQPESHLLSILKNCINFNPGGQKLYGQRQDNKSGLFYILIFVPNMHTLMVSLTISQDSLCSISSYITYCQSQSVSTGFRLSTGTDLLTLLIRDYWKLQ